jgi:uncharacterized C2H2 Zn-finger protein
MEIDLCLRHRDVMLKPLWEYTAEFGRKPDKERPSPALTAVCQYPRCGKSFANKSVLHAHVRRTHGLNVNLYQKEFVGKLAKEQRPKTNVSSIEERTKIRKWAASMGENVATRGYIPKHIVAAYNQAHQQQRRSAK